jgi:hypothetical protein
MDEGVDEIPASSCGSARPTIEQREHTVPDRQRETLRLLLTDEAWGQLLFQKLGGPLVDTSWDAKIESMGAGVKRTR